MDGLTILCPRCGKGLKVKDRSLLGKKAKCPACEHRFVLREPDEEVELELAEGAVPEGTSAQWVPDEPALGTSPGGARASTRVAARTSAAVGHHFSVADDAKDAGAARVEEQRRRGRRRRILTIAAGALTAVLLGGAYLLTAPHLRTTPPSPLTGGPGATDAAGGGTPRVVPVSAKSKLTKADLELNAQLVEDVRPTQGKPIELRMMPSGVNAVFHLRPAQLWSNDLKFQELRATMTEGLVNWIAAKLKQVCRREPQQIDEALIGLMLGARGTEPELAAVVRLTADAKLSDLFEEFRGELIGPEDGPRLYRAPPYAYLIHDARTIAICPAAMGAELAEWIDAPNYNTTEGILDLLKHTDRDRLFTVLFEVDDVRRHEEWLFADTARPAFRVVLDALSEDAETVCWSVHLGENFHSDLFFRTRVAGQSQQALTSPTGLAQIMLDKLEQLPHDLLGAVRKMKPQRKGFQQIIGRYPAMLETFRMASLPTKGDRFARVTTMLPAKAAPNLALGTMLVWDESTRTDFTATAAPTAIAATPGRQLPATVVERLNLDVDAEFSRTPLQEAFGYICGELQIKLEIDGDALKDAGFTQNMPQTFNLGKVPAAAAIHAIIKQYVPANEPEKKMVISIDEANKTLIVLTEKFAKQRGLQVHSVAPPESSGS